MESSILVESIHQETEKARQKAQPKTTAAPTGSAVERGKKRTVKYPPYQAKTYKAYFAVIKHLSIEKECIETDPFNRGGTRDTEFGARLHWAIYEALK